MNFGYFYMNISRVLNGSKKNFASDIDIHHTTISNLINNNIKKPSDNLIIRLELHSCNMIPAIDWFKLHQMEKGYKIKTSQQLRDQQKGFIKHRLDFVK